MSSPPLELRVARQPRPSRALEAWRTLPRVPGDPSSCGRSSRPRWRARLRSMATRPRGGRRAPPPRSARRQRCTPHLRAATLIAPLPPPPPAPPPASARVFDERRTCARHQRPSPDHQAPPLQPPTPASPVSPRTPNHPPATPATHATPATPGTPATPTLPPRRHASRSAPRASRPARPRASPASGASGAPTSRGGGAPRPPSAPLPAHAHPRRPPANARPSAS